MNGDVLRVANVSGFYGDRLSAMREMLEGGEVDVLTGDYLAELTMLILGRDRMRDPSLGYARTFLKQAEDCMGLALERGVRIVANAGGLNPAGLAQKLREVASALGLSPKVAHVQGDDLLDRTEELGLGSPLTANAYLGAFGIAAALRHGADIVVTGRVTDASVVVGPAAAHFGWSRTDYDELAGAMVAGHVIECGAQAAGGNFSGFGSLRPDTTPIGFPLAEISADGSSVITKHAGTGGAVTRDTVTAQLVYEVQSQTYLGPDVSARLDTIALSDDGDDRVRISGVRGQAPPPRLKVCVNDLGGFRNSLEFVLTGLEIDAKAAWVRAQLEASLADRMPTSIEWTLADTARADAATEESASSRLRVTVRDPDADLVGRAFTAAAIELGLASYPGFALTGPPAAATPYGTYRPAYVDQASVDHTVVHADGTTERIEPPPECTGDAGGAGRSGGGDPTVDGPGRRATEERGWLGGSPSLRSPEPSEPRLEPPQDRVTRRLPLGTFVHARSGDKGGDANIGFWVDHSSKADERIAWLTKFITADRIRELLPEAADLDIEVYPLPNLGAVNVVIRGLLGEGVAASSRFDPQGKGLGEWARSRHVSITEDLL
ncbi:MAG TPA: acyclic terpene utilization AtuA family protein [Nocardioidaceae bacterium]|nr:acyclic terpene utilization AtuA family protein [Nocardioidaceae bacterium]